MNFLNMKKVFLQLFKLLWQAEYQGDMIVIRIHANIRSGVLLKATVVVVDDEGMYLLQDVKIHRSLYVFSTT